MKEAVLSMHNVCFDYGAQGVLEQINLEVDRGEFLAVVGPNGGGKTTLLRLILGLLKPTQGNLLVFGQPAERVAPRLGYVPQHGNLAPGFPASARDVVLMGQMHDHHHGPVYTRQEKHQADEMLALVGMLEEADHRLEKLSGGQRQRVLLARALMGHPELLLLDEPLANIDPYGRQCILETLMALEPRPTIIMVSHDLGITAHAITSMAAVNRYLLRSSGRTLTDDMLRLMYGTHEEGCLHWPAETHE